MLIGYVYQSDYHCYDCAVSRYGAAIEYAIDREGNEVTELHCWQVGETICCRTCRELIYELEEQLTIQD